MAYATDSIRGVLNGIDSKFGWLRGLDLNQRPLGYGSEDLSIFSKLEDTDGTGTYFKEA